MPRPAKKTTPDPAPSSTHSLLVPGLDLMMSNTPGEVEAKALSYMFSQLEAHTNKIVLLGLYAFGIKARCPWGSFGQWLHDHAPNLAKLKGKTWEPSSTLGSYMTITKGVIEACGEKLTDWFPGLDGENKRAGKITAGWKNEPYQMFLFSEEELDPTCQQMRKILSETLAGKTGRALTLKFCNTHEVVGLDGQEETIAFTGAGKYHATKQGQPRLPKRTDRKKREDEAAAHLAGWKLQLSTMLTAGTTGAFPEFPLLPIADREKLKLQAYDLYTALVAACKLP